MTLQRRMMLLLLVSAPLVWAGALLIALVSARHEINELFDTQLIRLARQVQSTLPLASIDAIERPAAAQASRAALGDAELEDMAIAVWNGSGKLLLVDREGVLLPHRPDAVGFVDLDLQQRRWRVYYLQAASGAWLIAVGQDTHERDELVWDLIGAQLLPWVLTLPVLLLVMAAAVRRALRPLHGLTEEIGRRRADELQPLAPRELPTDLQPLVHSMNALFAGIRDAIARERHFTADAAHELRTPLAALQAQWEAAQLDSAPAPSPAADKVGQGLQRLGRLVTQLLALSRLDHLPVRTASAPIDWPALVAEVFGDLLPLADRRQVELACDWPPAGAAPFPLHGDAALLAAMLRNLLDNALRHAPAGSQVLLRFEVDGLEVLDDGAGVDASQMEHLGRRFHRAPGQAESGSGLGLSIVRRIAELHRLGVAWGNREDRSGFRVHVTRAAG